MLETKRLADRTPGPVRLSDDFRLDLMWWANCIHQWNGRSYIQFVNHGDIAVDASSDGWWSAKPGIGGYNFSSNTYFATGVPPQMEGWSIADLELLAVLIALRLWNQDWHGRRIGVLTDNEATRYFLLSGKSRSPTRLQMGRIITATMFKRHFRIQPGRISTQDNILADCLSRLADPAKSALFSSITGNYGVSPVRQEILPSMFNLNL